MEIKFENGSKITLSDDYKGEETIRGQSFKRYFPDINTTKIMDEHGVSTKELSEALTVAAKYAKDFAFSMEEVANIKRNEAMK